ncbi:MAG: hypothetical protein N3G78_06455 [Desulfobacterota bacterium]|nr:hypothetical protein [Thermodesulfobacteriota bacterium]
MEVLALDAIKPGMVLGGDVKDRNGRILLSAGSEITEKHLRIFRMWGVHTVAVQDHERAEPSSTGESEIDPVQFQAAEEKVRALFRHHDLNHPFLKVLFRLATLEYLSRGEGRGRGA